MAGEPSRHPPAWSRLLRRVARPFLSAAEKERVAAAIRDAESRTAGQIHVHLVGRVGGKDALEVARRKFHELGLHETQARNAVLLLVSHLDHRFAIWGDEGIHGRAGQDLWEKARKTLLEQFKERRYGEGIEACVRELGRELALHFPGKSPGQGPGSLPDEVTES